MKAKLKRCPFCNSHNLSLEKNTCCAWIRCHNCGATGPTVFEDRAAVGFWNGQHIRTNPSALVANRKSNHHQMKEVELD